MHRHRPTGWNTWSIHGFNHLAYLDKGRVRITVAYAVWDESYRPKEEVKNRGGLHRQFRWTDVERLGPHAPLGLPAALDFRAGDVSFRAEAAERDAALALTVRPLGQTQQRIVFLWLAPVGEEPAVRLPTTGAFTGWRIEFEGATWPQDYYINVFEPYAIGEPGRPATVRISAGGSSPGVRARRSHGSTSDAPGTFEAYERTRLAGEGALADAPQAMVAAVNWNTMFDTRRKLVTSPVSRDWCHDWRSVGVFGWDTFLLGAMIAPESPQLARLNFEAVTAGIDAVGMVPNYFMGHGAVSKDRSMPCLGAYTIWKTQRAAPDAAWLTRIYRRLRRWHRYWMKRRDGNGDGLLEWGSDAEPRFAFPQLLQDNPQLQHSAKCAMYESGLDNSPMYDDVQFNEQANTLELADIGLNCYYAMDAENLAAIAEAVGQHKQAAAYRSEYERVRERINAQLWDEDSGIYCNRHWDGRLSQRWSPTSFFPLIAGVAPRERAERMVHEHLLNEREFWGEFVIPSISRSDPAFPDNDYWRGRIWGPFNFLVAEGLRRYRFDDAVAELAHKSVELFMRNWRADGGVYENYNAQTGAGGDVWNAARLYHWGGLLVLIAMQELIDVEPAGFLRVGSLKFPNASLRNVRVGEDLFDVHLNGGVRANRNGEPFLQCSSRAIVRLPINAPVEMPIVISAASGGALTLFCLAEPERPARVNGQRTSEPTARNGAIVYEW
jgi:glycogen debranching enzyme